MDKDINDVHEEIDLEPLTDYSKFKANVKILINIMTTIFVV